MIEISLGIDVGSTTVKLVVVSREGEILAERYVRSNGQPRETLLGTSRLLDEQFPGARVVAAGLTGSGGGAVADLVGGIHVNELVAQTRAVGRFHPEARTVIEIGGQDSKFLSVDWDAASGQMVLVDFAMNALCAAGTGSFLDQQAERLGIAIDGEFAALALSLAEPGAHRRPLHRLRQVGHDPPAAGRHARSPTSWPGCAWPWPATSGA